ncbi:MAG: hypothetical protein Greene071436_11 [Parcubacteria group bacterium Greene0714_36]|nr:MAG: hypothetical protein Greene071436_11 [Parcubacteria group bacterium Greene0714_36]
MDTDKLPHPSAQAISHDSPLIYGAGHNKSKAVIGAVVPLPDDGKKRMGQPPAAPEKRIEIGSPSQTIDPLHVYAAETARRFRPFVRRRASTARPVELAIRCKKP